MGKKEYDVATRFGVKQRGGLATSVPERRPSPLHYVVAKDGDEGLEVLRVPLWGNGEALPVFSAGWAARGYLFAEAPGGGWYVKTCTPEELVSLLVGPCAGVEWVMLDPRPVRYAGEAANLMPWENFVDYLSACEPRFLLFRRGDVHPASGHDRANGDTHEEATPMWSKLFGGDGLPREKVDAVVRVIDRYLAEEAELRGLQSERQTVHPRDLPPDKRRALIE
jgi:hypothetical protein